MELLSKHDAVANTGGWRPDGSGVTAGADVRKPDIRKPGFQLSEAYSVRFVHSDLPASMIIATFYPVKMRKRDGFAVERQVEWLVCEDPADPAGTEVWSTYTQDGPYSNVFDSVAEADAAAHLAAETTLGLVQNYSDWDGQPWRTD